MKKRIVPIIILAMIVSLVACGNKSGSTNNNAYQDDIKSNVGETIPQEKTDNTVSGKVVEEFTSIADFNHDGVKETAKVVAFDDGQYFELQICNSQENIIWKAEAAKAHAGWLSLFSASQMG